MRQNRLIDKQKQAENEELIEQVTESLAIEDARLIQHFRQIRWGHVTVEVKNGKPVMGHQSVSDVKYTD